MPAVAAAACMEYCGLTLKTGLVFDMRRELELKLRDLESTAEQLAGDEEVQAKLQRRTQLYMCHQLRLFVRFSA